MSKYKKVFQDSFMQGLYEEMREHGLTAKEARKDTARRFEEYDNGKPLSIFTK